MNPAILHRPPLSDKDYWSGVMLSSFMVFLTIFFEFKNGKPFTLSAPTSRESHFLTIGKALEEVFNLKTKRLVINVPPGHGKSTMLSFYTAWCLARYPDCNFLYISYSLDLAEKHTALIKEIVAMPQFRYYFGVELSADSRARSRFKTSEGGSIMAFGSAGSVTGMDAGFPHAIDADGNPRFSGAVIIDDPHKPGEIHSETLRETVIRNYMETIKQRVRGPNVPIIFIGQRLHEEDLAGYLLAGTDGDHWDSVVLRALDQKANALYPEFNSVDMLKTLERCSKYVFASQYQQNPIPDGGGIFDRNDFVIMDFEPEIISTFLTIDTAESSKDYADYTVFGFFGIYKIAARGIDTGLYGLHWIDCAAIRVEPKDLEPEFFDFYARCMRHKIKPIYVAIEKKSTGVTLSSILKQAQGLKVIDIERTRASGSKTARFYEMQPYIASRRVSFTKDARHVEICSAHMAKITSNGAHSNDDIADVLQSAIQVSLMEGTLLPKVDLSSGIIKDINRDFIHQQSLQKRAMQWDY